MPKEEERIFMFLDIRSSTMIAERIGNEQYFRFIHDFINDATASILYAKGEIYQYVGDEIVVSWTMPNGLEDNNCLNCFFEIKAAIQDVSDPKSLGEALKAAGDLLSSVIANKPVLKAVVQQVEAFIADTEHGLSKISTDKTKQDWLNVFTLLDVISVESFDSSMLANTGAYDILPAFWQKKFQALWGTCWRRSGSVSRGCFRCAACFSSSVFSLPLAMMASCKRSVCVCVRIPVLSFLGRFIASAC